MAFGILRTGQDGRHFAIDVFGFSSLYSFWFRFSEMCSQLSWFTNPDRHCGIWITWLIGRTVVDLDCSLQALARCCRQTTCHIDMTEWAQTWLDSARRPCQCSANDNMQVTCHRITQALKRSEIGHTRYIGHASSRFPEIMHRWKLWIFFCVIFLIKIVLCQKSHQITIPYHRVKCCNVTDWPRWQNFENNYDI